MIKVNDRVKFLSDTGVGVVRSIEKGIALVETVDGFDIPAALEDLIVVNEEEEQEARRKIGPSEERPGRKKGVVKSKAEKEQDLADRRPSSVSRYGRVVLESNYVDEDEEE